VAETIKLKVEHLVVAAISGHAVDGETARWVATLGDDLAAKLAAVGLVPRRESATLGAFLEDYIDGRNDIKPASRLILRHCRRNLVDYFGGDRPLRSIGPGEADSFKTYLVGLKLAPSTIAKRLQRVRQMFAAAKRRRLIDENPFQGVSHPEGDPAERQRFIDQDTTARLLDACPDWVWRTIVALARYGGLRCPSEVLSLKWADVDWAADRLRVTSPKTAHHPGRGSRLIPMFASLKPYLQEAWDMAEEGQVYVVPTRYRDAAQGPNGWMNANLRTQLLRIMERGGIEPWPRLFHNLRASCETELAAKFPVHVVTAWLGNTPKVAMRHYLQVTDADFQKAVGALQNPVQSVHRALQKAVLRPAASGCGDAHNSPEPLESCGFTQPGAIPNSLPQNEKMAGTELEHPSKTPQKTGFAPEGAAKSGAVGARIPTTAGESAAGDDAAADPALALVVGAWPSLPESARRQILGIIRLVAQGEPIGDGDQPREDG